MAVLSASHNFLAAATCVPVTISLLQLHACQSQFLCFSYMCASHNFPVTATCVPVTISLFSYMRASHNFLASTLACYCVLKYSVRMTGIPLINEWLQLCYSKLHTQNILLIEFWNLFKDTSVLLWRPCISANVIWLVHFWVVLQ